MSALPPRSVSCADPGGGRATVARCEVSWSGPEGLHRLADTGPGKSFLGGRCGNLSGDVATQVQADLLGALARIPSGLHESLEPSVGCDPAGTREAGSFMSAHVGDHRPIGGDPGRVDSRQLPGHRRGCSTDPKRCPANSHALGPKVTDALPLAHRHVAS